jgi:polyhydroxybutyrate depolymerase
VPSLRLTVASVPLNCQAVPGVPDGCQVGGSGTAGALGKLRVYHHIRLGLPRPGGCREATIAGSVSGPTWSVPFSGTGQWCGQQGDFAYQLSGRPGGQGRLEYRHAPPEAATETFTGSLPAPPAAPAARDPARRADSAGCGRRPPARPGSSVELEVRADPSLAAGSTRRTYLVHVPASYRPDRPVPAVLLLHGNGGSAADMDADTGLSELADRHGFLAVYPQGVAVGVGQPFWATAGRVEAGGGVTALMACDLAGRVAAVATIAGALYTEPGECRPSRPIPVLAVHGTDDPVTPYGGRAPSVEWPLAMPPVPTWLGQWATRDGCPGEPGVFLDVAEVTGVRWSGCRDGTEVVHYRVNGGGHQAPRTIAGRPLAKVLWAFFAGHRLPG